MNTFKCFRALWHAGGRPVAWARHPASPFERHSLRLFRTLPAVQTVQTHILSDIGEGVKEVQIIQWFVEEGAAVEEWAPLCEVQSDKASVEITSRYTGIVKKLHFERDAIVQVGDAMLEIDVEGEDEPEEVQSGTSSSSASDANSHQLHQLHQASEHDTRSQVQPPSSIETMDPAVSLKSDKKGTHASLATPAVRGLLKQHNLDIMEVEGTGKDGRVLKEDIQKHVEKKTRESSHASATTSTAPPAVNSRQTETPQALTAIQSAMFKSMTKSLAVPHFMFSDSIDCTALAAMRSRLNSARDVEAAPKLSYLPFVVKAVSLALNRYPILNARVNTDVESGRPQLIMRSNHNIGVAMDTPAGLLVPVIKSVNFCSVVSIAQEIQRLSGLGQAGKLSNEELTGGTITVSNIGNIGGEVVAPVVIEGQLAILGMGQIRPTPVFAPDGKTVVRADLLSTSWSADHRVIDGATMARMAKAVKEYLEQPERMMVVMS